MARQDEGRELNIVMSYMRLFIGDYERVAKEETEIDFNTLCDISCDLETIESLIKDFRKHVERREEGLE